jgi:hypothetical protein
MKPLVSLSGLTGATTCLAGPADDTPLPATALAACPIGIELTAPVVRPGTTAAPPIPATPGLALNGVGGGGAWANPGTRLPGTFPPVFAWTTVTFLLDPSYPCPRGTVWMTRLICFRPSFQAASSCEIRLGTRVEGTNSTCNLVLAIGWKSR